LLTYYNFKRKLFLLE